ncbi:MAG: cupin domain-containing protein [Kiloniellales bacterium]|nr:cupin domain-containing protein [Kiloniellales bacterium]
MTNESRRAAIVLTADQVADKRMAFSHPWGRDSKLTGTWLSRETGMTGTGVGLITVPPGHESFARHAHLHEDEWVYILSGKGLALLGAREVEVGPGDFIAMPAPQEPHVLRNPFEVDLTYLTGGMSAPLDVIDFPEAGKRMTRVGPNFEVVPLDAVAPMDWTKAFEQ